MNVEPTPGEANFDYENPPKEREGFLIERTPLEPGTMGKAVTRSTSSTSAIQINDGYMNKDIQRAITGEPIGSLVTA